MNEWDGDAEVDQDDGAAFDSLTAPVARTLAKPSGPASNGHVLADHEQFLRSMQKGNLTLRTRSTIARAGSHTERERMQLRIAEDERRRAVAGEDEAARVARANIAELAARKAALEQVRARKAAKRDKKKKAKKAAAGAGGGAVGGHSNAAAGDGDGNDDDDDDGSDAGPAGGNDAA
jgi:hypothetical protein